MSFLSPGFLGALALVGIPLIIHLIRRRKLRIVRWAAMEFLRQSQKKQRRRLQIEELILLSLRMLIVAQAAADTILTRLLKPGDSASLVLLSAKPDVAVSAPSFDLNLVRERVRAAKVSDLATDYLAGAQAVGALLKASQSPAKEVYWLT